ncbi:hypothetical protein J8273_7313 [Carpediemonas membranifera]|uniref:Uncharacterized protein n=1 Tax=Carpediemonas membranifera TaxID=201153 RepID=A0A8J6AZI2_9EUKA|nr:hypothetical protein J8273_7313 [Carpediemonas membranifera]|eukprot:KAG9391039.1 hypothetical protein J8273_7313 [Carpediemonas membranifera]
MPLAEESCVDFPTRVFTTRVMSNQLRDFLSGEYTPERDVYERYIVLQDLFADECMWLSQFAGVLDAHWASEPQPSKLDIPIRKHGRALILSTRSMVVKRQPLHFFVEHIFDPLSTTAKAAILALLLRQCINALHDDASTAWGALALFPYLAGRHAVGTNTVQGALPALLLPAPSKTLVHGMLPAVQWLCSLALPLSMPVQCFVPSLISHDHAIPHSVAQQLVDRLRESLADETCDVVRRFPLDRVDDLVDDILCAPATDTSTLPPAIVETATEIGRAAAHYHRTLNAEAFFAHLMAKLEVAAGTYATGNEWRLHQLHRIATLHDISELWAELHMPQFSRSVLLMRYLFTTATKLPMRYKATLTATFRSADVLLRANKAISGPAWEAQEHAAAEFASLAQTLRRISEDATPKGLTLAVAGKALAMCTVVGSAAILTMYYRVTDLETV